MIIMASAASSFWPTISRLLPLCGRKTAAVGSLIAIASPSQACSDLRRLGPGRGVEQRVQERVLAGDGRQVALEDDRRGRRPVLGPGQLLDLSQVILARSSDSQTTWNRLFPSIMPLASL